MKAILVPTDFSDCADNAVSYATGLALKERSKILLCHSLEFTLTDILYNLVTPASKSFRKAATQKLQQMVSDLEKKGVKADFYIRDYSLKKTVLSLAADKMPEYIVMGTRGAGGLKKIFQGTNTSKIMERARCPVIIVPETARYDGMRHITYCTDYQKADFSTLKMLVHFARNHEAHVNVLHVYEGDHLESEKQKMRDMVAEVNGTLNYENISYQVLMVSDPLTKFDEYISAYSTSLLVMSTGHRSLMDKLLDTSETKELSYHIKIPLMVFHHAKEIIVI